MIGYEIFNNNTELEIKNHAIDQLLGYPDIETETYRYRPYDKIQKYEGTQWAGIVDNNLINACAEMTPEERLQYYDDSDLKSPQWLKDNNWFPPLI